MKVTKSIKHHVSMGNYEWVEFGAEIEIEQDTLESAKLSAALDNLLQEEIAEAKAITAEKKSYIHIYKQEN